MTDSAEAGLDVAFLNLVIDEGGPESRALLAQQLRSHYANPDAPALERQQIVELVVRLAADEEEAIRHFVITEFGVLPDIHPDIVMAIAASDSELVLPFLSTSQSLNAKHMLAILKVGDDARQAIIARRPDLNDDVVHAIVTASPAGAVMELLSNPSVDLKDNDFRAIYKRLGQAPEICERLLMRPELPADIRFTQAKRAASRMRQMMAEKEWLPAEHAFDLITDSEETAVLRILQDSDKFEIMRAMSFLGEKGMLTPALIVRAACLGEMRIVESILQHLSGMTGERTKSLMYGRGSSSFKSLFAKSGLPATCYGVLLAACEVASEVSEEGYAVGPEDFGRRMLEALMTRYETMAAQDRTKQIDYLGRYADQHVRRIAKRLKADLVRAA
jgi:uncharacterized protein (DUF2336 family)